MIALELWSYTLRRLDLSELAIVAGAAGFRHITCTPAQFLRSKGQAADLARMAADHGVGFSWLDGLCSALPGAPPPTRSDRTFTDPHEATLSDGIRIAHRIGAGGINLVHLGGVATSVTELADAFGAACRRAAAHDLRLGIEFLPGTGIPDLATAVAVVRQAGEPNGSVVFDSWHWARSGGVLSDLDQSVAALIGGVQLSDRTPDQNAQPYVPMRGRKLPGDGALPLAEIVGRIQAAQPNLPLGAEVLSDEIDALDPGEAARRLAQACRAVAAKAPR